MPTQIVQMEDSISKNMTFIQIISSHAENVAFKLFRK